MRPSHDTREETIVQLRRGSSSCQIVLGDDTVSRRHAELRFEDGRWLLRDLGSSNGTYVNGRWVAEAEVRPGDVIHLGGCRLRW